MISCESPTWRRKFQTKKKKKKNWRLPPKVQKNNLFHFGVQCFREITLLSTKFWDTSCISKHYKCFSVFTAVVYLRVSVRDACPPLTQNFFIFMQFSEKIGQIIGWYPPLELAPPSSGKSWIRHCFVNF